MQIENNGKVLTLNTSQVEALQRITEWLSRKDEQSLFFCLSGCAGTGKTTISKEALKKSRNIVVSAPTHHAKKVIQKATGYEALTIQKIVGLRPNANLEEFTHQNTIFQLSDNCSISEYNIVCIDESSMINSELLNFIKQKAKEFNVKILFMGDNNQLPPVKEIFAPVFFDKEIEQFNLKIVERQQFGNPLLGLYSDILSNIESEKDNYKIESNFIADSGLGYKFLNNSNEYIEHLLQDFKFGIFPESRVICWTNDKVRQWNKLLRSKLLGENMAPVQKGEFFISYRTVSNPDNWKITESENSCEYVVIEIEPGIKTYSDYGKKLNFHGHWIRLKNIEEGTSRSLFFVDKQSYLDFADIESRRSAFAIKAKAGQERGYAWKMYYDLRDRFFLLGDIIGANGKTLVNKDFDFNFAITTYKSQGSTFLNAYVDKANIDCFYDKKMTKEQIWAGRNRHSYVALSRPRKADFIYYK